MIDMLLWLLATLIGAILGTVIGILVLLRFIFPKMKKRHSEGGDRNE